MRYAFIAAALFVVAACGTQDETAARTAAKPAGQVLFEQHCQACHGAGPDKPGTVALATRYEGTEPGELMKRKDLTPEMLEAVARYGMANMPPFRKTEIGDADLRTLAVWLARQGQRPGATR